MCGIFTVYGSSYQWDSLENSFNKISYRGPDSSSFLHINNYIHDKIKDYLEMKKIEIKVLKKIGIDNPY